MPSVGINRSSLSMISDQVPDKRASEFSIGIQFPNWLVRDIFLKLKGDFQNRP